MDQNDVIMAEGLSLTPETNTFGFDKEDTVKKISYFDISKSVRVMSKTGRTLQTRPVQSWTVIAVIMQILADQGVNHELKEIYVQKKTSHPRINDADKALGYNKENCPLEKWEFDKVMTRIDIPNLGNDIATGTIAMMFDDRGITLALGMNVHLCTNFSILGGTSVHTFKRGEQDGHSWESIKAIVKDWIGNREQIIGVEMEIMRRMQEREISNETAIDRVIGTLYQNAIKQAYFKGGDTPFDTHGMSQFVQEMFRRRKDEEKLANVWDLYNWGTEIMKPGQVELSTIIDSSKLYADYLCTEFGIEKEDLIQEAEITNI
jgi:hypothetical protein